MNRIGLCGVLWLRAAECDNYCLLNYTVYQGLFAEPKTLWLLELSRNIWIHLKIRVLLTPIFSFQYRPILYSCWNWGVWGAYIYHYCEDLCKVQFISVILEMGKLAEFPQIVIERNTNDIKQSKTWMHEPWNKTKLLGLSAFAEACDSIVCSV